MQHKDREDLQVIQHQDLQVQRDRQEVLVTKDQLLHQGIKVSKDLKVTKVSRAQSVVHLRDRKDRKGLHLQVRQEEEEIRDLVEVQVIQHKDHKDQQVQVDLVVTKVLLATRELLVIKDQPHLRDLREQKDR